MRRFRIHDKIVIPFVLTAIAATAVAALVALSLVSDALESRVKSQIASGSKLVSQSDLALNPSILRLVREVAGADVITYTTDGNILASTLAGTVDGNRELVKAVLAPEATWETAGRPEGDSVLRQIVHDGVPYLVAYRRVAARPGTLVAFVADTSELAAGARAAQRTILLVAGITLVLLVIVSQIVARRVTGPLEALVRFTREVGPGRSTRRADGTGDDEVARLARAFNDMLDRLQTSQEALVRSEKLALAGLLAARVAHDVRNPLSSIKMQTQLLRTRLKGDGDNQALLQAVLNDIEQVETVVRGLLELARPGEVSLRRTRLNDIVEDVVRQVSAQMAHRKIAVEVTLDRDMPDIALDVQRFRQALLNVIVNAADAMPGGGTLSVAAATSDNGAAVILDVCDDGTGIDPAVAGRVFDPFVSSKPDGVGLGLVNTKAVVESHGGQIELSARPGRGTRARITLPVSKSA